MKFLVVLIFAVFSFLETAFAQGSEVPGVGSVWESTSISMPLPEDGSPPRKRNETFKVDRLENGRPVFAGRMLGHDGEAIESTKGTIVYALECKRDVPAEMLMPPVLPNQCIWHVCYPPRVGETFTRPMIVYAPIFGCQPQEGMYSFTSLDAEEYPYDEVTIGYAEVTLRGVRLGFWTSHIKAGTGQVFAQSPERVTTYDNVKVLLVPYEVGTTRSDVSAASVQSE